MKRGLYILNILYLWFAGVILLGWIDLSHDRTKEGNLLYNEGKYDEAISKYIDAQIVSPVPQPLYFNIANAQYKKKRYDEAIASYKKAIDNTKDILLEAKTYFNLGNTLYREGKLGDSLDYYKQAIKLANRIETPEKEVKGLKEDARFNYEFVEKKIKEALSKQKEGEKEGQGDKRHEDKGEERSQSQQTDQEGQKDEQKGANEENGQKKEDKGITQMKDKEEKPKDNRLNNPIPGDDQKTVEEYDKTPQSLKDGHKVEMSREEAERLLDILKQNEMNARIKPQSREGGYSPVEKDW